MKYPRIYWLLKHYDVLSVQGLEKLIVPLKKDSYYVHDDELFNTFQELHLTTGHGGRDRMMNRTKEKYKNIVSTDILLFINLCAPCQMKAKRKKKGIVSNLMDFKDLNSRCQIINIMPLEPGEQGRSFLAAMCQISYYQTNL
ncbi:hypothetical protein HUJ04_008267 [Dendroctonus ponderosae]|nr:hypothetical protein HUJ04_008267 [Dendroctonus ponderosae]